MNLGFRSSLRSSIGAALRRYLVIGGPALDAGGRQAGGVLSCGAGRAAANSTIRSVAGLASLGA